jgi:hypothetical protein
MLWNIIFTLTYFFAEQGEYNIWYHKFTGDYSDNYVQVVSFFIKCYYSFIRLSRRHPLAVIQIKIVAGPRFAQRYKYFLFLVFVFIIFWFCICI